MATKISSLPALLTTVTDTTLISVMQDGVSRRINGAALKNYTGRGRVVQVAQSVVSGKNSTSNTSYTTLAAANAFTPTTSTNKVLVMINCQIGNASGSGNADFILGRTIGGTTTQINLWNVVGGQSGAYYSLQLAQAYLDSPGTTSAVTYSIQGKQTDGTAVPFVGGRNTDSYYQFGTYFTLMEVEP